MFLPQPSCWTEPSHTGLGYNGLLIASAPSSRSEAGGSAEMAGGQVKAVAVAVGAVAAAASVSPAQAVTGQELLRQCDTLERGALVSGDTVRLPKSQDAATCWFY